MSELSVAVIGGDKDSPLFNIDVRVCQGNLKIGEIFEYCQPLDDALEVTDFNINRIHLKVLRISAYQKDFELMNSGMTCRVWFEGNEFGKIKQSDLLWSADIHPCEREMRNISNGEELILRNNQPDLPGVVRGLWHQEQGTGFHCRPAKGQYQGRGSHGAAQ
jgi:hypothetical protein